jgi:hypothetical protein
VEQNARLLIASLLCMTLAACSPGGVTGGGGTGGTVGVGGVGGSGPCNAGKTPVEQLIPTDVQCDLTGSATQCADLCELECERNDFELGLRGSGCAMEPEGAAYCRCICAYCRAR